MGLKQNTWSLDQWYDQNVAGNVTYSGVGEAWVMGMNNNGNLGVNNTTQYSSPVQIPGTNWSSISIQNYQWPSFGLKTDGTLWSWGNNDDGMGGIDATGTNYSSPIQIPGTDWSRMRSGGYGGMATKTDGTLWMWGKGTQGNLAQNDRTNYSSPRQVPGTTWSNNFECGKWSSIAVKTDGTLWVWGYGGTRGALGQNEPGLIRYSSPVQIPGATWSTTANQCDIGNDGAACMKTDGSLWTWGNNEYGRAGNPSGPNEGYSSPVQVGSGTDWLNIACSGHNTMGVKTDGTFWAWGRNQYGELGQGSASPSNASFYEPVQVGSGTDWVKCHMFADASFQGRSGVKTDGTLWAWGANDYGSLGQNQGGTGEAYAYSSPVQVPGTGWKDPIYGEQCSGAAKNL